MKSGLDFLTILLAETLLSKQGFRWAVGILFAGAGGLWLLTVALHAWLLTAALTLFLVGMGIWLLSILDATANLLGWYFLIDSLLDVLQRKGKRS